MNIIPRIKRIVKELDNMVPIYIKNWLTIIE